MGDSKAEIIVIGVIFMILPTIATVLRVWARSIVQTKLAIDDYLIFPALISSMIAGTAMIVGACKGGLATHLTPAVASDGSLIYTDIYKSYNMSRWLLQIFATLTIGFTKLSLLLLYRKVFSIPMFRKVTMIFVVVIICWTVSFFFATIFQCIPISTFWNYFFWDAGSKCFHVYDFYLGITVSDLITDVLILALPIPLVWRLQLPVKQRIAVGGMFLTGAIVCAAGIVRLVIFFTDANAVASLDFTYTQAPTIYWTYLESSLAIVGACLPTLRPIFKRKAIAKSNSHTMSHGSNTKLVNKLRFRVSKQYLGPMDLGDTLNNEGSMTNLKDATRDNNLGIHTSVEPMPMETFSMPQDRIRVQRDFVSARESV